MSTQVWSVMKIFLTTAMMVVSGVVLVTGCDAQGQQPAGSSAVAPAAALAKSSSTAGRHFKFTYAAELLGVPAGAQIKVWVPIPETNQQQQVERVDETLPGKLQVNRDPVYGNAIGFFETTQAAADAPVSFSLTYDTIRKQAGLDAGQKNLDASQAKRFLNANRLVPKSGKPTELLAEKSVPKDPQAAGELLYEVVENHMKYDKSQPGYGNGDAIWACDSRTGNCTDFHSLFISLARSQNIPARFEIGFPLSVDQATGVVGGYHCWAWFHVAGQGWLPVDISEADKHPELKSFYCGNLTKDRIAFSTGRDIQLVPPSETESLNYFVYPHVEVNGEPWPKEKIKLKFSYADVAAAQDK